MPPETFDTAMADYAQRAGLVAAGVDLAALKAFILVHALPKSQVGEILHALRDELAAVEHARWAHWQRYQHAQCHQSTAEPGALVIPAALVARWERESATPFAELSPHAQDSDREQVDSYLSLLAKRLSE